MMFGRLKPGITIPQAQAQIKVVDNQLRREYPVLDPRAVTLRVEPAREHRILVPVTCLLDP
jgi:hypothetical protein